MGRPKIYVSRLEQQQEWRKNNKEKIQQHGRTHYLAHKEKINQSVRDRRDIRISFTSWIKLESGCIDCGYNTDPYALEFDHVRGEKVASISHMISSCAPIETILDEIDKCEVRCANCHRIRTRSAP